MLAVAETEAILRRAASRRVVVVGDLILDEYFWGEIERISAEAPVPVLQLRRAEHVLGGAANVARNLASLGALVSAAGVVGTDTAATALLDSLDEAGIDRGSVLFEAGRPTTRKCRLMSSEHGQQVFRFDVEVSEEIPEAVEERLLAALQEQMRSADAVICSDYRKGVLTPRVLREITVMAREQGIGLITAPKDTKAEKYTGATVLMPNLRNDALRTDGRRSAARGHRFGSAKRVRRDRGGGHGARRVCSVPGRGSNAQPGGPTRECNGGNRGGEARDGVRRSGRNSGTDR